MYKVYILVKVFSYQEKVSTPQITISETTPSSLLTTTSTTTSTPSKDTTSKQLNRASTSRASPTILSDESSKLINATNISSPESIDHIVSSPDTTKTKTSLSSSPSTEQIPQSRSITSKTTTPNVQQTTPIDARIEEKPTATGIIPRFYFSDNQIAADSKSDADVSRQLRKVHEELFLPKHNRLNLDDFGQLAQVALNRRMQDFLLYLLV